MAENTELRQSVVERYSGLARLAMSGGAPKDCESGDFDDGCFGAGAYFDADAPEGALRASLGCGNPLAVAEMRDGEVVLDLGAGGGLDVLLSARRVGPTGKVYGLDASAEMLELARGNAAEAGVTNVEFRHGHIEDIPLPDNAVDVVISNCVINLSVDKARVLAEPFRVLRPGGRFGVSDVIADDGVDGKLRSEAKRRIGCTNGTLTTGEYRQALASAGFTDTAITRTAAAGGGVHSAIIRASKTSY